MSATVPPTENPLVQHLRTAAAFAKMLDDVVDVTRDAIVTLGAQIAAKLAELDPEEIKTLGITVEVVTRSDGPIQEDVPGLTITHLPTIDSDEFERRPGATALYLDAFHGRPDRVLLQIQSTPGVMVSATSTLERIEPWLEPVCGIVVDAAGEARLVRRLVDQRQHFTTGLFAGAQDIVHTFIEALTHELQRRERFNCYPPDFPRRRS